MPVEMPIGAPMIIENLARNFFGLRSQWVLLAKIIDVLGAAEKEQENMHQMVLITLFALRDNTHAFGINLLQRDFLAPTFLPCLCSVP